MEHTDFADAEERWQDCGTSTNELKANARSVHPDTIQHDCANVIILRRMGTRKRASVSGARIGLYSVGFERYNAPAHTKLQTHI
jgi:hypothetical protein